jgi:hypothetical protein
MPAGSLDINVAALAAPERLRELSLDTDWSGKWFDLVEKESGEFMGMRAAHVPASSGEVAWRFCSHSARDGLGALVELMRRGSPGVDIAMPRLKDTSKPPLVLRVAALLRLMAAWPRCAAWKTYNRAWTPPSGQARPGTAVAAQCLDAARTARLQEKARADGVSFNSLLLAALARASQPELGNGRAYWMMPVNMRGPIARADESANHTAYLRIKLGRDATSAQVHDSVKRSLRRGEHWGSWLFLHVGRLVGDAGMRCIYRLELARWRGCLWTGAFSNLGSWQGAGSWLVCPPVAKSCPLGAGVIVCDGRLGMTIDAHPSIAKDAAWTRALMDRWLAELATLAG